MPSYSDGDDDDEKRQVRELTNSVRRLLGLDGVALDECKSKLLNDSRVSGRQQAWDMQDIDRSYMTKRQILPRQMMNVLPPKEACIGYKVVALINNDAYSIYDGITNYAVGTTWFQEAQEDHASGLYVYRSYEQCLKRDASVFPSASALLHADRGIATVICWNAPAWKSPKRYGMKEAFDFLLIKSIRPYPDSWYASSLAANLCHGADDRHSHYRIRAPGPEQGLYMSYNIKESSSSRNRGKRADSSQISGISSMRNFSLSGYNRRSLDRIDSGHWHTSSPTYLSFSGTRAESLMRRQVQNLKLEDDISRMEQELERMRV